MLSVYSGHGKNKKGLLTDRFWHNDADKKTSALLKMYLIMKNLYICL